ncbi:DUF916 domain-containing protein, partial [Micromonospora fiedleri]|nr:DUF916 domain-containing protein [Micromonospora fiedleri]
GRRQAAAVVARPTPDRVLPTVRRTGSPLAVAGVVAAVLLSGLGWLLVIRLRSGRRLPPTVKT